MKPYTPDEFRRKLDRWMRDHPDLIADGMRRGLERIVGHAKLRHLSGPKMPRGVGSPTNATLQPRSGDLRAAMGKEVRVEAPRVRGFVVNPMEYAAKHEYGSPAERIPQRSFAGPSIDAKMGELLDDIRAVLMKGYRKS